MPRQDQSSIPNPACRQTVHDTNIESHHPSDMANTLELPSEVESSMKYVVDQGLAHLPGRSTAARTNPTTQALLDMEAKVAQDDGEKDVSGKDNYKDQESCDHIKDSGDQNSKSIKDIAGHCSLLEPFRGTSLTESAEVFQKPALSLAAFGSDWRISSDSEKGDVLHQYRVSYSNCDPTGVVYAFDDKDITQKSTLTLSDPDDEFYLERHIARLSYKYGDRMRRAIWSTFTKMPLELALAFITSLPQQVGASPIRRYTEIAKMPSSFEFASKLLLGFLPAFFLATLLGKLSEDIRRKGESQAGIIMAMLLTLGLSTYVVFDKIANIGSFMLILVEVLLMVVVVLVLNQVAEKAPRCSCSGIGCNSCGGGSKGGGNAKT